MYATTPNRRFGPPFVARYNAMTPIRQKNQYEGLQSSGSSLVASTSLLNWANPKDATDNEGSLSSGYGGYYCDNGVNIAILALTLAGLAAMFYVLYTKITMLVGRKRRHAEDYNSPVQKLPYSYTYNINDIMSEIYWGMTKLFKDINLDTYLILNTNFRTVRIQIYIFLFSKLFYISKSKSLFTVHFKVLQKLKQK